jgi:hypothetical protein
MTMDVSMHVGRCLSARVCVRVCWMVPAGRAAHCAGAGEPALQGDLAQTVSLAPGVARHAAHQAAWA